MDVHRWSSLFRTYDLGLRHNQLILVLSVAGCAVGIFATQAELTNQLLKGVVGGATVFLAGVLAKEIDPDRPQATLLAAALAIPFAASVPPTSLLALFWLLGTLRFLNRSTGLAPKPTDLLVLLCVAALLGWQISPLFGILMGIACMMDVFLPGGRRLHGVVGMVSIFVSTLWLFSSDWSSVGPALWLVGVLLAITLGFIPVILSTYHAQAVGDATGERLNSSRVQAGQAFGLSAGLFLASWMGSAGALLLIALWAAMLGTLAYYLLMVRLPRSVTSL